MIVERRFIFLKKSNPDLFVLSEVNGLVSELCRLELMFLVELLSGESPRLGYHRATVKIGPSGSTNGICFSW